LPAAPRGVGPIAFTVTTDNYNQVFEYNADGTAESNNTASVTVTSALGPAPDLQVSGLSVEPATGLQSGSRLVVHWNDANTGTGAAPGSWSDSVTLRNTTTGETLTTAAVAYDASANGAIQPGASGARQHAFTLPDGPRGTGPI